jgi:hypothetical protein
MKPITPHIPEAPVDTAPRKSQAAVSALVLVALVVQFSGRVLEWTAPTGHAGSRLAAHLFSEEVSRVVRQSLARDRVHPIEVSACVERLAKVPAQARTIQAASNAGRPELGVILAHRDLPPPAAV